MTDEQYRILLIWFKKIDSQNQTIVRILNNQTITNTRTKRIIESLREKNIQLRAENLKLRKENQELTRALEA